MVQVTRSTKFTSICVGLYVSYAVFVFFLLPMLLPDPVTMYRAIVAYQTRYLGNLSNYTLESGGQPIRSMLVTMRGSAYQGRFLGWQHAEQALEELICLYKCNYNQSASMLNIGKRYTAFRRFYGVQWKSCMTYAHDVCCDLETLGEICKLFPFINMSVYNLRLKYLATLLEKKDLNIRILLLVRDPRGTMYSRSDWNWCIGKPDCDNPSNLCKDMVSDYVTARKLIIEYPQYFGIIRYEDLAQHPDKVLQYVFDLFDHQFKNQPAFEWLTQLSTAKFKAIEDAPSCKEAMKLWGYRSIKNVMDFSADTFDSLMREPIFSQNEDALH